jgi:ADP-heptose:LPS heptosyltransferase/2-polyprenyl-3-methyl-5-hydroxy-6-metoxy-1,4-benzoquinol methylase
MLTAAVRDLHAAHPGRFRTAVQTSAPALWENNPYLAELRAGEAGVEVLDMHYPLIHQSNQRPYHFIHGYVQYLEDRLNHRIPVTRFHGDIHLSEAERRDPPPGADRGVTAGCWVVVAGGKYDFTAKWWDPARFQEVVDHFAGRLQFVQCGEAGHWHPRLKGVIDLVGHTTLRELIRLVCHADGVLCPVTLAMHLAAAVPARPGGPGHRACVVVAGGREPAHWEAYPNHQFLGTNGALPCCQGGGCWRSRCQPVGDGDAKDRHDLCAVPVQVRPDLRIPRCMDLITAEDVIRRIELYYRGGALQYPNGRTPPVRIESPSPVQERRMSVLIRFRHGLGDAVQLGVVLRHLRHYHPDWDVDVAALVGKHSAFAGLCRRSLVLDRDRLDPAAYQQTFALDWPECRTAEAHCPSTKATRCLRDVFRLEPVPELCSYTIRPDDRARELARRYLGGVCSAPPRPDGRYPAVLVHYQANTSVERKDLAHDLAREVCEVVLRVGLVPVILDWDRRSPLPDGARIHNPGADHELWGGTGTGDAGVLAALIDAASLFVGVDSGPLHVAGATDTPTVAVWTQHHPVHFFDLARNVIHLVPGDHATRAAGPDALRYFASHYRHRAYRQLHVELPALVESLLTGENVERLANRRFLAQLGATSFNERYYEEHRLAGLDYLGFGDWQRQYGRWLVGALGLRGRRVLDVGCACGSILRGLGEAGAVVQGVDVNEHMIRLGREQWPDMAPLLHVCDAVNLHLFADGSWDAVHTAQVAEHWRPHLVPHILAELARVVVPGGLLFCCLDTEELFARQGRRPESEDPTHVCVRPRAWWHERLAEAGWQVCTGDFERTLRDHPASFLTRYDWDWFVARRVSPP